MITQRHNPAYRLTHNCIKEIMVKKICVLLALILAVVMTGCGEDNVSTVSVKSEEEVITSLIEPTVMITVGEYRATGVIVGKDDGRITIYTVAHLMAGYDQGIIRFYDGKAGFANVLYCDEKSDVCILTIDISDMDEAYVNDIKTAEINADKYDSLNKGDEVYLVGSAVSVAGNVMKATFEASDYYVPEFDSYLMYLYGDAFEGMSGSGCYTKEGYLVGLVTGASDTGEVVCIPINEFTKGGQNNDKN